MIAHPVTTAINVSILAIILTYVSAMKVKCGYCTTIPETQYVTTLVALFPSSAKSFLMSNPWIMFILFVVNVANIIFLYRFIRMMNISQCRQCTSEWRRSFLYYYSTFILILYAINIVLLVVGFVILSGMSPQQLSKLSKIKYRK